MRHFVELIGDLERSDSKDARHRSLVRFFSQADDCESAWAITRLLGKSKRLVTTKQLQEWACDYSGTSDWLWDDCLAVVGSVAETAAKLCASESAAPCDLVSAYSDAELASPSARTEIVNRVWRDADEATCYVWNRILCGGFRFNKIRLPISSALSEVYSVPVDVIAGRLLNQPSAQGAWFRQLVTPAQGQRAAIEFREAVALKGPLHSLGPPSKWHACDAAGERCRLIRSADSVILWSHKEGVLNDRCPELIAAATNLASNFVMEGHFSAGRLVAYDALEHEESDLRPLPLTERLIRLEQLTRELGVATVSPGAVESWDDLASVGSGEGVLLRRLDSSYLSDRPAHAWRTWLPEPRKVTAVLMYAHKADAQRYTHLTFGLERAGEYVSFCKTMEGMSRRDLDELFAWIRGNTLERVGPVRTVPAHHVFEISLQHIEPSSRHKCGYNVRSPRVVAWRTDLSVEAVDSIEVLADFANGQPKS